MSDAVTLVGYVILAILVLVFVVAFAILPIYVARRRGHASREAITVCTIVGLFIWPAWVVALIWAYTGPDNGAKERELLRRIQAKHAPGFPVQQARKRYDAEEVKPVASSDDAIAAMIDAPRVKRFRVSGIDRQSKLETTGYYEASTEANARAKAELDGILVTAIGEG